MSFWQILGRFALSDTGETLQKVSDTTIVCGQHPTNGWVIIYPEQN